MRTLYIATFLVVLQIVTNVLADDDEEAATEAAGGDGEATTAAGESCVCLGLWEPVCGEDDVTYTNNCVAKCAGQDPKYYGVCGEEPTLEATTPAPTETPGGGGGDATEAAETEAPAEE